MGGLNPVLAGPRHILDVFEGNIPACLESGWLENDEELKALVIKAYRYAYKLVFDQAALGAVEDPKELEVLRYSFIY